MVKFKRPKDNEENFFHYKHKHSMNVQVVSVDNLLYFYKIKYFKNNNFNKIFQISDNEYVIRSLRICPGSNNDKHIWNFSDAKMYMHYLRESNEILEQEGRLYLIGNKY